MLVAIGKGIELDVDVTRFNIEVHDHIVRTGLRNLLMDATRPRLRRLTQRAMSKSPTNWPKRNWTRCIRASSGCNQSAGRPRRLIRSAPWS